MTPQPLPASGTQLNKVYEGVVWQHLLVGDSLEPCIKLQVLATSQMVKQGVELRAVTVCSTSHDNQVKRVNIAGLYTHMEMIELSEFKQAGSGSMGNPPDLVVDFVAMCEHVFSTQCCTTRTGKKLASQYRK
jgi:hypothetical protein